MKTIEQVKAEQVAALARHEKMLQRAESFAAAGLPIPEYIADGKTHGAIHISYRNDIHNRRPMSQAVAMFANFANTGRVIPFHVLKDGCFTTMHPESRMPEKKHGRQYARDAYKNAGYAAELTIRHNGDNHHTAARLEFFAIVADELYSVSIDFGTDYIGACSALRPQRIESRGYANRITSRKFAPNKNAHALADAFLTYSYGGDVGPIASGSDHRHLFVSDTDHAGPVECSHAVAQLENLAGIIDPKKGE